MEQSAGGVVLRRLEGEVRVLLIRDPYKKWGLPKGHLEKDESPAEAAMREVREETGLQDLTLGPELGQIDWLFRARGILIHKYCTFFAMHCPRGEAVPEIAEGITECVWLSLEVALGRIAYDNAREILRAAAEQLEGGALPFEL